MAKAMQTITDISASQENLVTRRERRALFGIFRWEEFVSAKELGTDLKIYANHKIRNVYLNGKKLTPPTGGEGK